MDSDSKQLVIVEWRDILQTSGCESHDEVDCPVIRSVGWLIPQDDLTTIKLCNTLAPENFDHTKGDKE